MILPDGDLLAESTGSLAAVNMESRSAYCYAGTEAALNWPLPAAQDQTIGPAKWVDFLGDAFVGADKLAFFYPSRRCSF